MPNSLLGWAAYDAATAHPESFKMSNWVTSQVWIDDYHSDTVITLADLEENSCGTTACYAGWTAVLCGDKLGRGSFAFPLTGEARSIEGRAADLLGIDEAQANVLFGCTEEVLRRHVEDIFGPRPAELDFVQISQAEMASALLES